MVPEWLRECGGGRYVIDTGMQGEGRVASHLLVEGGRAAFIDVGATTNLDRLLGALSALGLPPHAVEWVMVTHVHLDHAGAAGALMKELPEARLLVHPRGARHMIDPSRLVAGATAVYGEEVMGRLFGEVVPVPAERVVEAEEGMEVPLAGRRLAILDTPGHARHHYCVHDPLTATIWTGDTFGLSYREFDSSRGPFVMPTTTPVQFDPDALHRSIDRLMALAPRQAGLAHFGLIDVDARVAADLHAGVDAFVALALEREGFEEGRKAAIREAMTRWVTARLHAHGSAEAPETALALLAGDLELNSQGLDWWLDHRQG